MCIRAYTGWRFTDGVSRLEFFIIVMISLLILAHIIYRRWLSDFLPKLTHVASRFYGTGLPSGIGQFLHGHEFPTVRGYSSLMFALFLLYYNKGAEYLL